MVPKKSLDDSYYNNLITALIHDLHLNHGAVFNNRSRRLTLQKMRYRLSTEGIGFLTKTLPRLGKAFDKALTEKYLLISSDLRFKPQKGSKLPRFLGEFFNRVFKPDGTILQDPDSTSVEVIRQVCYLFYKYKLPYSDEQEQEVIDRFKQTEQDLSSVVNQIGILQSLIDDPTARFRDLFSPEKVEHFAKLERVVRRARGGLSELFRSFDPKDIYPRHGPGAVATKQQLAEKYVWTNVSANITRMYPFDTYFCASMGHFCDTIQDYTALDDRDLPARVVLVPKDSRGPRLISCEPVDYQWIQQGLGNAIRDHVESHPLTKWNVFYTDQGPNQRGALLGSSTGRYATLDLNEASDRVSLALVRLLFPPQLTEYLEACRSSSTELPNGEILRLNKFAPMGSNLCFPILSLVVWSILTAGAYDRESDTRRFPDTRTKNARVRDLRESILVYGDDVIVPTAYADEAMELLESFGLKINRDKSCTSGFFRESCGTDAFRGKNVTPVRLRTVWSSHQSADVYASWIAYANSFFRKRYYTVYNLIVDALTAVYGSIPTADMELNVPSLCCAVTPNNSFRTRTNKRFQKKQYLVWDLKTTVTNRTINGWAMLLRYFAETRSYDDDVDNAYDSDFFLKKNRRGFRVRSYTPRRTSVLVRRWR